MGSRLRQQCGCYSWHNTRNGDGVGDESTPAEISNAPGAKSIFLPQSNLPSVFDEFPISIDNGVYFNTKYYELYIAINELYKVWP